MDQAPEGRPRRHRSRWGALALVGASAAALSMLAIGPALAATTTTTSTTSTSSTSTTEGATTTTAPTAVTVTKSLTYTCAAADAATMALVPKPIPSTYVVTSKVPKFLENGQSFAVSFSAAFSLDPSLTSVLPDGTTLKIAGALIWTVSGGGTGGPYNGSPTSGTVTVTGGKPGPLAPITASGTVKGTDKTKPIIYSMNKAFSASITVTVPPSSVIPLKLNCSIADPAVASTNGSLPPEPSTTTSTTVAVAPTVTGNPSFTG